MNDPRPHQGAHEIGKDRIAQAALDDPLAEVVEWRVEPVPNAFGTPTTESMERVHGIRRGLESEGLRVARADLARSVDASLVVRCVFTALPLERLPAAGAADDPAVLESFGKRARSCRMLVDRGSAL